MKKNCHFLMLTLHLLDGHDAQESERENYALYFFIIIRAR